MIKKSVNRAMSVVLIVSMLIGLNGTTVNAKTY